MIDDSPSTAADPTPPEVTLEPADNGWIVRHHQRSSKKDEPGRTIRRLATTDDEALGHAKTAMTGGRAAKKKFHSRGGGAPAEDTAETPNSHSHPSHGPHSMRSRARRRRPRASGRR
jgi:hypothetical protein